MKQEAVQVHTPPASVGTAITNSRGFFLDLGSSINGQESGVASVDRNLVSSAASRTALKAQLTSRGKREWWDEIETSLASDAPVIRTQIEPIIVSQIELSRFEWNTPEHLPNSPLCPLNQKGNTGNIKGTCVYHGRK
jgi:hypothetical protein